MAIRRAYVYSVVPLAVVRLPRIKTSTKTFLYYRIETNSTRWIVFQLVFVLSQIPIGIKRNPTEFRHRGVMLNERFPIVVGS